MKVLITGICGFVGSEVALRLREQKPSDQLEIVGIDNLSRNGSWRNRQRLQDRGIDVVHGDIRAATDVDSVGAVDWVIDAAANPSVLAGVDGKSSSRQLVDYNLTGTVNLLEFCKQHGAGFLLLSTSRVYSIPPLSGIRVEVGGNAFRPSHPLEDGLQSDGIGENFSTAAPVSLYGATKLASEQLAMEYGLTFDFPVWINRCGVIAGAGQFGKADQGIFAFWLHSWRENRPLRYIGFGGHGHQVRDCLHPRDLVPLLLRQMNEVNAKKPAIVNVSGGQQSATSLAQLSDWCTDRWGSRDVAADSTPRPFDLPWVVLDHSLATESWDWKPETSVQQILTEIADFADQQSDWIGFSK